MSVLRPLLPLGLAAAVLLGHAAAGTQDAASADLSGLVAAAESICEVDVLSAEAALLDDGTIETRYSLATRTPIKGVVASIQELRMPGGEVAGRGLLVPGLPRFAPGERVVLFLSAPTPDKAWRFPVGLESGAVRLSSNDRDAYLAEVFAEVQRQDG